MYKHFQAAGINLAYCNSPNLSLCGCITWKTCISTIKRGMALPLWHIFTSNFNEFPEISNGQYSRNPSIAVMWHINAWKLWYNNTNKRFSWATPTFHYHTLKYTEAPLCMYIYVQKVHRSLLTALHKAMPIKQLLHTSRNATLQYARIMWECCCALHCTHIRPIVCTKPFPPLQSTSWCPVSKLTGSHIQHTHWPITMYTYKLSCVYKAMYLKYAISTTSCSLVSANSNNIRVRNCDLISILDMKYTTIQLRILSV